MSASNTVIVFGPTGNVGSIAARTAHANGAKVILAMRDPTKPIPGLISTDEASYERVAADLTDPSSVEKAARQTHATRAFIYLARGSPDHMRSSLAALKSAGVAFVVFLSSYTIALALDAVPPAEVIPYWHAQVERSLGDVFGDGGYMAVRPGYFATNTLPWKHQLKDGKVRIYYPRARFDYITPVDMGEVCGRYLAGVARNQASFEYIYGPERISQEEAARTIAEALGVEVEVEAITREEEMERLTKGAGIPEPLAGYLVETFEKVGERKDIYYNEERSRKGTESVRVVTGRAGMTFREWVEQNKELYT